MVAWLDQTDLDAAADSSVGLGPTAEAALALKPERLVLLSNYPRPKSLSYRSWLMRQHAADVDVRQVQLDDPTDYREVYLAADEILKELSQELQQGGRDDRLIVHLTPGNPTMQAVWVILGSTRYPVRFIRSSKEKGVSEAKVPFELSFEHVDPDLRVRADDRLSEVGLGIPPESAQFGDIVGRSKAMMAVIQDARLAVHRAVPVLILGESGTGKELLARAIHEEGRGRSGKPFVAINCGAIPKDLVEATLFGHKKGAFTGAIADEKGKFESADGGTLFLDEIGEMPLEAQVTLLRVLQEKSVVRVGEAKERSIDVRVIAATNRPLLDEVTANRFREDLYYRLAVLILELPPLRERHGDLFPVAEALLKKINQQAEGEPGYEPKKLSAGAKALLQKHSWPGNVRELENTLMRVSVWTQGATVTEKELERAMPRRAPSAQDVSILGHPVEDGFSLDEVLNDVRRHYLKRALEQAQGNKTRAAKLLGLNSHQVLSGWLERLGIET
jgi:transcriptional regulator with GAF, ATPase, and Fis domain